MTARLVEHLPTISTAPDGVKKLRELILQLAVMGKLVPQDPNDEPASELLERIQAQKNDLIKAGKLGKEKPLGPIVEDEKPYQLPESWVWSRIGTYVESTEYGISEKTFELSDGIPVVKMGDIQEGKVILNGQKKVDKQTDVIFLKNHDLLYNRTNSAELVGKTGLFEGDDDKFTFASYLIRIRCLKNLSSPKYLNLAMNAPEFRNTQIAPQLKQQCGQANVNGTIMRNMLVSLPPLAEQHRIVAKVDELMALCDCLEAQQADAEVAHTLLVKTLLEALTQGTNAADLAATWERIKKNFDTLFTTEASVDTLKQTLLQLAVMGKLTAKGSVAPQSALTYEYLAKARKTKYFGRLAKKTITAETNKKKPAHVVYKEPMGPSKRKDCEPGWLFVTVDQVTVLVTDGKHGDCQNEANSGYFFLSVKDLYDGRLHYEHARQISKGDFLEVHQRTDLEVGDLLLTNTGAIGRIAIATDEELTPRTTFQKSVALLKPVHEVVCPDFLGLALRAMVRQMKLKSAGSAISNLLLRDIRSLTFDLPPLAEQHRIVAKFDELMAICDLLQENICKSEQLQCQLSDALIGKVVVGSGQVAEPALVSI